MNSTQMDSFNRLSYELSINLDIITERDNEWREQRLKALNNLIHSRIEKLQNPFDCKNSRKLVCNYKLCGFGCILHHLTFCLIQSIAHNRTMIIGSKHIEVLHIIKNLFQPLSHTCGQNSSELTTNQSYNSYQVLYLSFHYFHNNYSQTLYIPKQISSELQILSAEPFALFVGSLLEYLMRPKSDINIYLRDFKKNIGFKHPIVGIHVRRTDKLIWEAKYHSLDEYMSKVINFYNKLDLINAKNSINKSVERVVYLATDEPNVWDNEIKPYVLMGYKFIGDSIHSRRANTSRSSYESTRDFIINVLILSECDYIVCTFSSNVCRLVFELMQSRKSVVIPVIYSLDCDYYFLPGIISNKAVDYPIF